MYYNTCTMIIIIIKYLILNNYYQIYQSNINIKHTNCISIYYLFFDVEYKEYIKSI